jgi:type VI secretion system secreted protein VgrG
MSDLITISSSVLPDSARVVGFRGTEAISRPYEIEIFVQMQQELGEDLDLADGIGAKAKLVMDRVDVRTPPFVFAGVFANMELLHAHEGHLLLRCTMVPRLWQLGLSMHSRIFTKMKVPDIIRTVLEENGVTDVEMRLGTYETEEHVSQYHESDLDFISRWMEREGIYYFFEHTEDGEKLVLCDQRLYDEDEMGSPVRFYAQVGHDVTAKQSLKSFKCRHAMRPASVRLKDYDYAKPGLNVSGSARVADNGAGEVSAYGKRFFTSAAGERLAKIRAEELLTRQVVYNATGTRHHLRPGYTFELEEHPLAAFNTKYLTIEAHHVGNQATAHGLFKELTGIDQKDVYQVEIDAIPAKTQFRAESRTAWPRIYGVENGVVDGPAESDYAQIDEQGRYLCKFKYDESKLKNGKATTFVRMMQPHGGDIEGFHFPLRKGTEVVFSFLGGDVDRPVIAGVVPNAVNPSPVTLANYTKNVIQTGARNRMEIEDKAGNEWIRWSTPYASTFINMGLAWPQHELNLSTQNNAAITAMQAFDIAVGNPEPGPSGAGNMTVHVLNNLTTTVDNQDLTTTVSTGNMTTTVKSNMTTTVQSGNATHNVNTGTFTELVQSDVSLTYNATKTEKVANGSVTETYKSQSTNITTTQDLTTGGTMTVNAGGLHTVNSKASYVHNVTGSTDITTSTTTHIHSEGAITIDTPADITMEGNHVTRKAASEEWHVAGLTIEHKLDNKIAMTAGASIEAKLALALELTAAIKIALELGVRLNLNFAFNFEMAPFKHELKLTKLNDYLLDLATTPTHTRMAGLVGNLAGLFAVV